MVDPRSEWRQMFCEAWRVLRDEWVFEGMQPGDVDVARSDSAGAELMHSIGNSNASSTSTYAPIDSNTNNSHSARWRECLRKYATKVLPLVAAKTELDDLFAELAAELRSSHVTISTGDSSSETKRRKSVLPGRLGCDLVWVDETQGYKITHLIVGDAWDTMSGGCLVKPGVNISVGDVLLKINGKKVRPRTYRFGFRV